MEGVLPLSLALTADSAKLVGAHVRLSLVEVVRPSLISIDTQLRALNRLLRSVVVAVTDSMTQVQQVRLRVQIMNDDLLDHIEATRWAVAYLSYNTFLELLDNIRYMRWLDGRSHIHLHDIIAGLAGLRDTIVAFAQTMIFFGQLTTALLMAILDQLRTGIGLTGQIQIVVSTGGLGDFLKTLDLWKLLGLLGILAVGLALIVAFLFGVGAALATFGLKALLAAVAIGKLVDALLPLMKTLVGFDWGQLAKIGAGFAGITGFVYGLGKAFGAFTTDLEKIVPQLNAFFEAISRLMTAIAGFDWGQLAKIGAGFAAIAGFVYLLGKALATFTDQAVAALQPLAEFFTAISRLMSTIAAFSVGQLLTIAAGFLLIAGFVWGLSMALGTLTAQAVAAMPGLTQLLGALGSLAQLMASMSVGELITMGVGLAMIALFVWAVAAALVYAAGPLNALAKIFESFGAVLDKVTGLAGGLWDVLSGLGGLVGDVLGGIGDFFGDVGGFFGDLFSSPLDAVLAQAQPAAAISAPPPTPPPAPAGGLGPLSPGGALAAAPGAGVDSVDQSVNVNGGITVNVSADKLEADSASLLSDNIVAQLQQRLGTLRAEQDFRAGARPAV